MTKKPRVTIVDDDVDLCEALRWLLESDDLDVQTYNSAQDFLDAFDPRQPGVLVLDVRMRGMDGLELQEHLRKEGAEIPVIILTGHGDIPMAIRALKAGAREFLQKPVNDQTLLDRIRKAIRDDAKNHRQRKQHDSISTRIDELTPREREVMDLVVSGKANKQIADKLCVSEKTIEVHRKRVMRKMQAGSAVELVRTVLSLNQARQTQ